MHINAFSSVLGFFFLLFFSLVGTFPAEVNQAVHLCGVSILCVAPWVGSSVLTPKQRSHGEGLTPGGHRRPA